MKEEPELLLSQFEPDPDGFEGPDRSPPSTLSTG
jgi:hypothetical protein